MIPTIFIQKANKFINDLSNLQTSIIEIENKICNETTSNFLLKEHPISNELYINIERIKEDLENLNIKLDICVFGKFNSGKSSFINALLGKEVAVVDVQEMTYTLNYITYGQEEKAKMIFIDSRSNYMSIKELNELIRVKRDDLLFREKIDTIELTFPYEEIKDINIWDTPGLGSTTLVNREKALSIMEKSDVILWVIDVENLGDADDNYYIEIARNLNKPIICIVNKMDIRNEIDASERIIQYINEIYSSSFSEVFLVSSKSANLQGQVESPSKIYEVKKYLETNVFKKKQEIIIGSTTNSLRNRLHNIQSLLYQFKDKLDDHLQRYSSFSSELESRISNIIPDIKEMINNFVVSEVFEEEYLSILSKLNVVQINSSEDIDKILTETITESKTLKYVNTIYKLIKDRIENGWNTAIILSSDTFTQSDKYFNISNSSLLSTSESEVKLKNEVVNDLAVKVGVVAGSLTSVSMLAAGTTIFSSIFSGFIVFGGVIWGVFKLVGSSQDKMQGTRRILKEKIEELRLKFNKEVVNEIIIPKVEQSQIQMTQQILKEAELKIFNNSTIEECQTIISRIDAICLINDEIEYEVDSLYDLVTKDSVVFQRKIELSDFIIERENPNPGIENLRKILASALQFVYFVDPYFQEKSLSWLKHINPHVSIKVLLYHLDEQFDQHHTFISKLEEIRKNRSASLLVRMIRYKNQKGTPLHDRFIFSKDWGLQLGNGLDAIGKKDISVSFIQNSNMFMNKYFSKYWDATHAKWEDKERPVIKLDL